MVHCLAVKHIQKGHGIMLNEGDTVFLAEDAPSILLAVFYGHDIAQSTAFRESRNGLGHIARL